MLVPRPRAAKVQHWGARRSQNLHIDVDDSQVLEIPEAHLGVKILAPATPAAPSSPSTSSPPSSPAPPSPAEERVTVFDLAQTA